MNPLQNKKVKIKESVMIGEKITAAIRSGEYRCFWYLVCYSIKESQNSTDSIHIRSFLLNGAVMAVMTIESFLNDLVEFYLPEEICDCLMEEHDTKLRFKKMIEFLTGQNSTYEVKDGAKLVKIKKTELNDFFKLSSWYKVCELIKIRNKIVHCKVEDGITVIENGTIIKRMVRDEWYFDINNIIPLVESTKKFILELKVILEKSIDDCLKERFVSRFSFLDYNIK